MVLISLLWNWNRQIRKLFWFTWLHLDEHGHKVVVAKHTERSCFWFGVDVVSVPLHYIIFKCLAEAMLGVNLVFYDFLSGAAIEEINPSLGNFYWVCLRSFEKAMLNFKWPLVNVEDWKDWECNENKDCPDPPNYNCTFTKFDMPNRSAQVLWYTKASLDTHNM